MPRKRDQLGNGIPYGTSEKICLLGGRLQLESHTTSADLFILMADPEIAPGCRSLYLWHSLETKDSKLTSITISNGKITQKASAVFNLPKTSSSRCKGPLHSVVSHHLQHYVNLFPRASCCPMTSSRINSLGLHLRPRT